MLNKICEIGKKASVYMEAMGKIDERMYVVRSGKKLMIFDPNICDVLLEKISDWEISDITILLTHEHYDHITGVKWLLEHFRATVIGSCGCKRILDNPIVSVQDYYDVLIPPEEKEYYVGHDLLKAEGYVFDVHFTFESDYSFIWQGIRVECVAAPGHSIGGAIYTLDETYVFTGDNLVNGSKAITRFPGGSRKDYLRVTVPIIHNLKEDSIIFPGHGEMENLKELLQYI